MSQPIPNPSLAGIKVLPEDVDKLLPVESPASLSGGITLTNNDSHRTSPYLNEKIRNICLILSVMVVLNHSRTLDMDYGWDGIVVEAVTREQLAKAPIEVGIQHLLSGALGRITNPFFFMASGFLFFFAWQPSLKSWFGKMRKRIFTLLLPYLAWSFIGMSMNYLLYLSDNLDLMIGTAEARVITSLDALVFFFRMPVPPQLWFLRALMLMIVATPLVALAICTLKRYSILLILAVYFSPFETPWGQLSKSAICFFSLGAALGYSKAEIMIESRFFQKSLFAIWIALAGAYTILSLFVKSDLSFIFHCVILFGILGIWAMYDLLPSSAHAWLSKYSPYRFFIYMASEPLLSILSYKYFEVFETSQSINMLQYVGLPFFVVLLCGTTAYCLRRRFEQFYLFLSGGR